MCRLGSLTCPATEGKKEIGSRKISKLPNKLFVGDANHRRRRISTVQAGSGATGTLLTTVSRAAAPCSEEWLRQAG